MGFLHHARAAEQLVQGQHRVIGRVIGVVAGRAIDDRLAIAHGVIVRNGDGLVMSDEEAILRAGRRAPRAHARVGAGLVQIDRCAAASLVGSGVGGHPLFMGAPAQFRRLHALGQEALDRPGVDEDVARLGGLGHLRVALGDMHALDAQTMGQAGPAFAGGGLGRVVAEVAGDVDQRLLHEPGDHAGIGAAGGDRRGPAGVATAGGEHGLAQRIVRALVRAKRGVEIKAGPGLDDRVDVEHAQFTRELHQRHRGGVDRKIDAEALPRAIGQQGRQQFAIILLRHGSLHIAHAALVQQGAVAIIGIDDDDAAAVEVEVTLDERQGSLADRAEADHHDGAGDGPVDGPVCHASNSK